MSLDEVQQRYLDPEMKLRLSVAASQSPAQDLLAQLAKTVTVTSATGTAGIEARKEAIVKALEGKPTTDVERAVEDAAMIAPRMFRASLVEQTSDFATNRQQDAEEFMRYVFTRLAKAEKGGISDNRIAKWTKSGTPAVATLEEWFHFQKEERYESSGQVAYIEGQDCFLTVPINLEDATEDGAPAVKKQKTDSGEETEAVSALL